MKLEIRNRINRIFRNIEHFKTHIISLPLHRKFMALSLVLITVSYYTAPVGVLLLCLSLIYKFYKSENTPSFIVIIKNSTFLLPGIVLIISTTIGAIYNQNYNSALLGIVLLLPLIIAATIIEIVWEKEDSLHFARYTTLIIIPICIIALMRPWQGSFTTNSPFPVRLSGTFSNPNYFSYILAITILFIIAMFYHVWKKTTRNWLVVSLIASIVCLYLTGSRTGMLAFLVGLTVFMLAMSEKSILVVFFSILVFLLVATAIFPEKAVIILKDVIPRPQDFLIEFNNRFKLWDIAFKQIAKEPFWGTGLNTYSLYIPQGTTLPIVKSIHSHNIYINFWLEMGVIGTISFFWIVIRVLINSIRNLNSSGLRPFIGAVIGMIVATLTHGLMDAPLVSSQTLAIFVMFLASSCVATKTKSYN